MNKTVAMDDISSLIREQVEKNGSVVFTPKGVSMLPMLRHGSDTVELVKPKFPVKKYQVVFFQRANGRYILHRVVGYDKDGYIMRGDNQYVDEHGIKDDQIIAVLESFKRKGKEHSVTDIGYRLYCHVWTDTVGLRLFLKKLKRRLGRYKRKIKHAIKSVFHAFK